jgi:poly(hydroxyalkanoate) depolymerase family esterase
MPPRFPFRLLDALAHGRRNPLASELRGMARRIGAAARDQAARAAERTGAATSAPWTAPPPRPAAPGEAPPPGALWTTESHLGPAGARSYRLYVPASRTGAPMPLVVMLHGCTQSPDDFAVGTRMNRHAEERGWMVLYPAQSHAANSSLCWNWFAPADQARGAGEPATIVGMAAAAADRHPVDRARIYAAGLSAGGAEAAILGALYPDVFAAVGVHSGLAYGAARDLGSAFAAMQEGAPGLPPPTGRPVPAIVFHGDRDETVNPRNAEAVAARVAGAVPGLRSREDRGEARGGRRWTRSVLTDADGRAWVESWTVHGAGHAWSGGSPHGSHADPAGPDASAEMARFFAGHPHPSPPASIRP